MAKIDSLENAVKDVKFKNAMGRIPVNFAKEFGSRGVIVGGDIKIGDDMEK